jgi:N-[(2S)-2-amino-2-carboxyethyl]-L-glutamate dehydrogenase
VAQVHRALDGREKQIVELVEATYRLHAAGEDPVVLSAIPGPTNLADRYRAVQVDGLKWTSSFPRNVALRTPRASAVPIVGNFFHDLRRYG